MNRFHRLGRMILLFLFLANGLAIGHATASVEEGLSSGRADEVTGPGEVIPLRQPIPPWKGDMASHSDYQTTTPPLPLRPELQRALDDAADDETVRVIVTMRDVGHVDDRETRASNTVQARRALVSKLKGRAERAQGTLRSYLEDERAAGRVSSYQPLWITNAIAVDASPSVVRTLARHPSVASIDIDHWRQWVQPDSPGSGSRIGEPETASRQGARRAEEGASVAWNVSEIRADEVWQTLQVSGTGAVVAGMDTGVDWFHPSLRRNYRGYHLRGPSDHAHSWFDATGSGALYPVDGHGHGSHTMGTIVGEDGIGVAPGAQWIAVRVLNSQGYGFDSWIHAGFQWLLAPGGDPSRAPDLVNCSWGNENAYLTTFQDDLRALRAAGVLPVFSTGNEGPDGGSVSSPASLPEAFAVGAVDPYGNVARFSSRGPSPWGETRPHVVAPGVEVRSSTPGGAYAPMDGTSMAAPHVSGVAAMLRSVSSTLSISETMHLITSTAVPLGQAIPNNDSGWGRVDAFAAVTALTQPGFISGRVTSPSDADPEALGPVAGAVVTATSRGGGGGSTVTGGDGLYRLAVVPGIYDVRASAFGHVSEVAWGLSVMTDTTTTRDFILEPKPSGDLRVGVFDEISGEPMTATVKVLGTPRESTAYSPTFQLPVGDYVVRARRIGHRVVTATAAITAGETTTVDLILPRGPSILLIDSGGWYYDSEITYFRQALEELRYAYDEWPVRSLEDDVPVAADLMPYDVVVWSAPRDAPGYIGAGGALGSYLEQGGRLFLSGQDVGFWDGGGTGYGWSPYYYDYLKVRFVDDNAPSRVLVGEENDILSGQTITITGPGGADNQDHPDVIAVVDSDGAVPVLTYEGDGCGGVRVGTCLDYRALYLPFGFEAINERPARQEVMERSLAWLMTSPPRAGLELRPEAQLSIGRAGYPVTHTVRLRHVGQGGDSDRVSLKLEGASWPTTLSDASIALSPCASATVTVSVTIPPTAAPDQRDTVTLTARSSLSSTVIARATLTSKTPAPILLVDDDRWYDQQATYREAMSRAGFRYDVWETAKPRGGHGPGPREETLGRYPVVVWWTGYDWYAPVTEEEEATLRAYLDDGGRLMLSAQDFLYHHHDDPFAQRYLGVLTYTEDITPTQVEGVSDHPVGTGFGPWSLTYPRGYQNWSDGVVPAHGVGVAFRDQDQRGVALTRREGKRATLFFAFPFEALPKEAQASTARQAVGWLSWLGRSTFDVEPRSVTPGATVTYTLSLHNDGAETVTSSVSNTLPTGLAVEPGSLLGPGRYDLATDRLSWRGTVQPNERVSFSYRARVLSETVAAQMVNTAELHLEGHQITFERNAALGVNAPELSRSTFGCMPSVVRPGKPSTCTVTLRNSGPAEAETVTALIYPPGQVVVSEGSVWASHGGVEKRGMALFWSGPLSGGEKATLRFRLETLPGTGRETQYGVTFIDDGAGNRWERPTWLVIQPWTAYLPLVRAGGEETAVQQAVGMENAARPYWTTTR